MTVENCKMMLEQAKAKDNKVEIAMLEARIIRKLALPKYAHLKEVKAETKSTVKK